MTYIIFLVTIQIPFLYFVWKLFHKKSLKVNRNLQILKKQNEHIANFMDTLRMSVEKISDDIYSPKGSVPSKLDKIGKQVKELQNSIQQMEIYTGLNTSHTMEEINFSQFTKDKDFK